MVCIRLLAMTLIQAFAAPSARDLATQLGQPLTEDTTYYRWQSTTSGENLDRAGVIDAKINHHFMTRESGIQAGGGIYLADTAHSSESYLPMDGGNLLEVKVKKGVVVIDLMDPKIVGRLKEMGLPQLAITHEAHFPDGVLVRYQRDYFVGKNLIDRATMRLFPGPQHDAASVATAIERIQAPRARDQLVKQIRARRPELAQEITRNQPLSDLSLRLVPAKNLPRHLVLHSGEFTTDAEVRTFYSLMKDRPEVAEAVVNASHATARIFPRLLAGPLAHDLQLSTAPTALKKAMFESDVLDVTQRSRVARDLLVTRLNDPMVAQDLAGHVDELLSLLKATPLNSKIRTHFAIMVQDSLRHADDHGLDLGPARQLIEAGGLREDYAWKLAEAIDRRRTTMAKALATREPKDLREAFRDQRSLAQLGRTVDTFRNVMPTAVVNDTLRAYLDTRPDEFAGLFTDSHDWTKAVDTADRVLGVPMTPHLYQAALEGPADTRELFLEPCLKNPSCAKDLLPRLRAHPERFFRGVKEFFGIVSAIDGLPTARREELARIILNGLNPEQVASFAKSVDLHPNLTKLVLARVEELSLGSFRSTALLKMAKAMETDKAVVRRLHEAAAVNVAFPAEANSVANYLRGKDDERTLGKILKTRLSSMNPTLEDITRFNSLGLKAGTLKFKPGPAPDCVNRLARVLDYGG